MHDTACHKWHVQELNVMLEGDQGTILSHLERNLLICHFFLQEDIVVINPLLSPLEKLQELFCNQTNFHILRTCVA